MMIETDRLFIREFTPEMVQIQASRSHEVGAYHLVKAENPIWIAAFRL